VNYYCCVYDLVVSHFLGMEESGSEGLDELIQAEAGPGKYFDGVDCVCIVCMVLRIYCACSDFYAVR